jgi:hypothetical protein
MIKRIILFVILIFCLVLIFNCKGFFYPKVVFTFKQLGVSPPFSASERLKLKDKYSQEIILDFQQGNNQFKTSINIILFVRIPYNYLYIQKMKYDWENGSGLFLSDAAFKLPNKISDTGNESNSYYRRDDYYWTIQLKPIDKRKSQPYIDFQDIFTNKKPGEKFNLRISIEYSFDKEPAKTLEIDYQVTAVKGRYISHFNF